MRKEKDYVIAELRRQLEVTGSQQAAPPFVGDAAMMESVMVTDCSGAKAAEESSHKDDLIKELQSKITEYQMSASSRDAIASDKVSVRR